MWCCCVSTDVSMVIWCYVSVSVFCVWRCCVFSDVSMVTRCYVSVSVDVCLAMYLWSSGVMCL